MAVTLYDLTANFADILGEAYDPARQPVVAWIETNLESTEAVIDRVGDRILLGGKRYTANSAGFVQFLNLIGSDSTPADTNLVSGTLQYKVSAEYVNVVTRRRQAWTSGWFSLTADIALADVVVQQYAPVSFQTQQILALTAIRTQVETLRDEVNARVIVDLGTSDGQVSTLLATPGSLTRAAELQVLTDEFLPLVLMGVI